ncbi:hypothetical protein ABT369_52745 [Dactylosporangium sp. NPDC000244]|uniref:hypothetical protein n=1 Tax=Dactylosporangium sp. NPDC000244 TaxID=3154365 RepID=UPI00333060F9
MRQYRMDHSQAPLLEALEEYHRLDRYGYTIASPGLDDRSSSNGYLARAGELMADGADTRLDTVRVVA